MSASVLGIIIIMANIFFVKIDSCNPAPVYQYSRDSVSVCLCRYVSVARETEELSSVTE